MDWRDKAECRGMTEMFYNDSYRTRCRQICGDCPVQKECLQESIELEDINQAFYGIRGGMIPSERIRWRMRRIKLEID